MKVIVFDSVGGASGDMILAALMDLGVSGDELSRRLSTLGLGPVDVHVESGISAGIAGKRLHIHVGEEAKHHAHDEASPHDHEHPPHRGIAEIEALIVSADLPKAVKERACRVFRRLGEVEARIHGTTIDRIHFHEIGAVDSIVDIVGSCLALHMLSVESVVVGPLPLGTGTVQCAHGVLPNPAPATMELLRGFRVEYVDLPWELVTPTGAALLAEWRSESESPAGLQVIGVGYGLGHRDLVGRPNLLRATLLETDSSTDERATTGNAGSDLILELRTNVDDSTPELLGAFVQRALAEGALDAYIAPIFMKKQRPAVELTILCRPENREKMLDLLFRETTTFGVREAWMRRTVLDRRVEVVRTEFGDVRIKVGTWRGRDVVKSPEMDDCIRLAESGGVSVRQVYEQAKERAANLDG